MSYSGKCKYVHKSAFPCTYVKVHMCKYNKQVCADLYINVLADGNFTYKMAKNKIAIAKILYMNQRNETCSSTYEKEKQHTEKVAFYDHHNKFYLCELARLVCARCDANTLKSARYRHAANI